MPRRRRRPRTKWTAWLLTYMRHYLGMWWRIVAERVHCSTLYTHSSLALSSLRIRDLSGRSLSKVTHISEHVVCSLPPKGLDRSLALRTCIRAVWLAAQSLSPGRAESPPSHRFLVACHLDIDRVWHCDAWGAEPTGPFGVLCRTPRTST